MIYDVKYKKPGWVRWRKLKRVKGDGLVENNSSRYFILEDEARIELPTSMMFIFSNDRFRSIKKKMDREAGMNIAVDSKIT